MIEASVMRTVWNDDKISYEVKAKGLEFFGKEHPLDIKSIKTGLRLSKWNPKMGSWKDFRHNLVKEPA